MQMTFAKQEALTGRISPACGRTRYSDRRRFHVLGTGSACTQN